MRPLFLLVLLIAVVCVSAINLGKIRDFKKHIVEKIKNAASKTKEKLKSIKDSFMAKIKDKMSALKSKIMKKLKPTKEQQEDLDKRMKNVTEIKHDHKNPNGDSIFDVNANSDVASTLYQSDIMLSKSQANDILEPERSKRQAFRDRNYPLTIWQTGVYFQFHETAHPHMREVFYKAATLWMNYTCIDFFEDDKAENRIIIGKGQGCWSMIGRNGGIQELSLGEGCDNVGTATHELGHALGFFHPMSRHDRDKFLTINIATVRPDFVDQFNKESSQRNHNYGMTYDFGSIMHYGATSASPQQKTTMVAYDTKYQRTMGSHLLSFLDLSMMNEHYKCKEKCPKSTSAQCKNGGFPNPRNCKICICPSGFGGDVCDQRSPPGTKIEVQLGAITQGYAYDGCVYGGVEIKTGEDIALTGYRFCAPEDVGTTLTSATNLVPYITFSRAGSFQSMIQFRMVGNGTYPEPPKDTAGKCLDTSNECEFMANGGFCQSPYYTDAFKKYLCAKSCKLC
ncbi:hypothetical protein Aduo_016414 [Ancylostoma duodenale]